MSGSKQMQQTTVDFTFILTPLCKKNPFDFVMWGSFLITIIPFVTHIICQVLNTLSALHLSWMNLPYMLYLEDHVCWQRMVDNIINMFCILISVLVLRVPLDVIFFVCQRSVF